MDKILKGAVASLHLHPPKAGEPLLAVDSFTLVEGRGIVAALRFFGRKSRRQVTLLEREWLAKHAEALGLAEIPPGAARANIETTGIDLQQLIGHRVRIGETVLEIYEARTPCYKMDAICQGLRELMKDGKQGVLATVIQGGAIRVGDQIILAS